MSSSVKIEEREELVIMPDDQDDTKHELALPEPASSAEKTAGITPFAVVILFLLVIQNCAAVQLTHFVQQKRLGALFSTAAAVCGSEAIKAGLCFLGLVFIKRRCSSPAASAAAASSPSWRDTANDVIQLLTEGSHVMLVPAIIFAIENNLIFVAAGNLEPALFVVLYQSKLIMTALVWTFARHVFTLKHAALTKKKWIALAVIFLGIVMADLHGSSKPKTPSGPSPKALSKKGSLAAKHAFGPDQRHRIAAGIMAVIGCAVCSAIASVFFEVCVKREEKPSSATGGDGDNTSAAAAAVDGESPQQKPPPSSPAVAASVDDDNVWTSLLKRNVQLASYSFVINLFFWLLSKPMTSASDTTAATAHHQSLANIPQHQQSLSSQKSVFVPILVLVVLNAFGGLLVSMAITFSTSVYKAVAVAAGIVLQTVVVASFNSQKAPSVMFVLAVLMVVGGTVSFAFR